MSFLNSARRLDRVVEERDQRGVGRLVQVVDAEVVFNLLDARLKHTDGALLLVDLEVLARHEALGEVGELGEPAVRFTGCGTGDDERGARLIDEDGVDLVDYGEEVAALHHVACLPGHVVAKVVEAELVVGAVGDVARVLFAALLRVLAGEDHARGHSECTEDAAHEFGLVAREVVIDGDDVHAAGRDRVEVCRHDGDEGLAFTGLHLRNVAEVQVRATHELHVEGPQADGAHRCLTHGGERLRQQVFQ